MIIAFEQPIDGFYSQQLVSGAIAYVSHHEDVTLSLPHINILGPAVAVRPDGIISYKREVLAKAVKAGIPAINPSSNKYYDVPCVSVHDDGICNLALDHFKERNLQTVGFLYDLNRAMGTSRKRAFVDACLRYGFTPHLLQCDRRSDIECDQVLIDSIITIPKPAGILLLNHGYAPRCFNLCNRLGIRVPEDLAVVGINNDFASDCTTPTFLSGVDINVERIGYEATRLLTSMIKGEEVPEHTHLPPGDLIIRGSSDTKVAIDPDVALAVDFMRSHLSEPIELEDILRCQRLGRRAVEKHFKATFGRPPMQHLRTLRLNRAKAMLRSTELTVAEIGRRCGIPDSNYLCRLFRNLYTITPQRYRESINRGISSEK